MQAAQAESRQRAREDRGLGGVKLPNGRNFASMMELADMTALEAVAFGCAGSTPAAGTT